MNNLEFLLAALGGTILLTMIGSAAPQVKKEEHVNVPAIEARPEDVSSIDAIIKATYETISGGVAVPRQWSRDLSLFDPNARLLVVSVNPETKMAKTHSLTHEQYVDGADSFMVKEGFVERELGHKTNQFGHVASVLSSYEGKLSSSGKVIARGVNIFTLYNDGKRWWILSIIWDEEHPDNLIPAELLPKQ